MRRIVCFLLICLSFNVFAQDLRLSISAEAAAIHEYQGQAGETIRVSATALDAGENTPDLVLWIVHKDNLLAYSDNGSENPVISLTLPEDGLYLIYVDSFNGVSLGEADLLIEIIDPFNIQTEANQLLIDLPAGESFRHNFEASGDITIRVRDVSGGLDPYIRLLNASGELVGENDDHASNDFSLDIFDSRLSLNVADSNYNLEIRDFLGRAGQLELSIE